MEGNEVVIQIEHVFLQHFPLNASAGLYAPAGARDRNKLVNFVKNFIFMNLANEASPGIFLLVSDCLLETQMGKKSAAGNAWFILGIAANPFFTIFSSMLIIFDLPLGEKLLIETTIAKHAIIWNIKSHFTQIQ